MNHPFRIRSDLPRTVLDGYVFPLGVIPVPGLVPREGWCVDWNETEGEACCTFHVVASLDRLAPLLHDALELLPESEVFGILELGSRDAYRTVDVYLGARGMERSKFLETWALYEPLLLEEASLAIGVNGDDPFVEVFLDPDKGLLIHVNPSEQERVESMLARHGIKQVADPGYGVDTDVLEQIGVRPILEEHPEMICDMDQLLMELKHDWNLELDEDPTTNLDGRGRRIGRTLWHAVVILEADPVEGTGHAREAHATVWGTASSRDEMELLVRERLRREHPWCVREFYTLDRAAFDDRPEEINWLTPRPGSSSVHMLRIDPFKPSTWMNTDG